MPFCALQSSDPSTTSSSLVQCSSGSSKGSVENITEPLPSASDLLKSFRNKVLIGKSNSEVLQDWLTLGGKVDSLLTSADRAISETGDTPITWNGPARHCGKGSEHRQIFWMGLSGKSEMHAPTFATIRFRVPKHCTGRQSHRVLTQVLLCKSHEATINVGNPNLDQLLLPPCRDDVLLTEVLVLALG